MSQQDAVQVVLKRLRARYPRRGALEFGTPYHMLVMVILSARTRDEQVLKLAPEFFAVFPTVEQLAKASIRAVEKRLATIGLFRAKAKNVKAMAEMVVEDFDGKIPSTMKSLVLLPGVGRKTASVVLVAAFGVPAIAVDVHVHRVANRLGWVTAKTVEATELALLKMITPKDQPIVNRVFVPFGRAVCVAGAPRCWACPVKDLCAFPNKNLEAPQRSAEILHGIAQQEATLAALRALAEKAV